MSYECRVYAIQRVELARRNGKKPIVLGVEIARFELYCVAYSDARKLERYLSLFTRKIDYDLFDDSDNKTRVDCYGEHLKAATVEAMREYLHSSECAEGFMVEPFKVWLDAMMEQTNYLETNDVELVNWGH